MTKRARERERGIEKLTVGTITQAKRARTLIIPRSWTRIRELEK